MAVQETNYRSAEPGNTRASERVIGLGTNGKGGRVDRDSVLVLSPANQSKVTERFKASGLAEVPGKRDAPGTRFNANGVRGCLRMLNIARVLGLLALYLYLDSYELRSEFNRRMSIRRREESRVGGWRSRLEGLCRFILFLLTDRFIRTIRFFVFRGGDGSEKKQQRIGAQSVWLARNLIALGPTFIKIGQALGTRADLLPLPYVTELSKLQDQVPAFPTAEAFLRIESELGCGLSDAYREIDPEPIAAASLGQVYRARLLSGEEVAVKVQRPDLERIIGFDIAVLHRITGYITRFFPGATVNADWEGMLSEFAHTVLEEMDYEQEGRHADRFRENFKDWRAVHVPRIYWSHTTRRVLTMAFIRGTKVIDMVGLKRHRLSPIKVNRLLVRTYLKQLLEDGFFHADPHPGNLLVMDTGQLAFLDFGMVGRITSELQSSMIDAFFHVISKDVKGLARDLIDLKFLKPGVDPESVRPVVESLFQHYINLKLGEVNFKELTYELADVMYEYPFRLPANFTYVMRALMTLEGIGIVTDPEFNFFDTAKPYAREFMLRREGKQFRKLLLNKFLGRSAEGRIDWSKMWKLAKMAANAYLGSNRSQG